MTSSLSSWVTARKAAGVDAHSVPKRRVPELVNSPDQSSLGDILLWRQKPHNMFNLGRIHDEMRGSGCYCCVPNATQRK